MPIYEYRCTRCGRKSEFLTLRVSEEVKASCGHCGSDAVLRVPSRVRVRLSEETRMERLADPSRFGGLDENDPKSVAKFMKAMGQEMGEDLGDDVDTMVDQAMEEADPGGAQPGGMDDEF